MLHTKSESHWPFDLCRNSRLRSLQLEITDADSATTLVTQMLSQLSAARIEEVRFIIGAGEEEILDEAIWNEIDAALQHPSFSGLKTVNIRLVPWEFHSNSNDVFLLMDRMPQCHARGILHVCAMNWPYSYFLPPITSIMGVV